MSTKSDILYGQQGMHRIYEETSSPQMVLGKFKGFDIEIVLDKSIIKGLIIKDQCVIISFDVNSEIAETTRFMKIYFGHILEFEMDDTDLMITVKGGSIAAEKILRGEYL